MAQLYPISNEIAFWGLQMAEHLLFIYLGLVDLGIEQAQLPKQKGNNLRQEAIVYYNEWQALLGNPAQLENPDVVGKVKDLLVRTKDYESRVLKALAAGKWIGWISFSFVEHMLKELEYFFQKLTGAGYELHEELDFWLWHDWSETAAEEKLIDPKEEELAHILHGYVEKTKAQQKKIQSAMTNERTLAEALNSIEEFYDTTAELGKKIEAKQVLTNIAPSLARHVLREAERSLDIFKKLEQVSRAPSPRSYDAPTSPKRTYYSARPRVQRGYAR